MSLHDVYARVTPFELAFPEERAAHALVSSVAEESTGRGADPSDLQAFMTMAVADTEARRLEGSEAGPGGVLRYGPLVFHGYHFAAARCPLYLLTVQAARYLAQGAPNGSPTPPDAAGYLQFPQHLFWADGGGEAPESVDGVFWATTDRGAMHALLATGVRPDRAGLGVVPLPEAPLADAASWLDLDARGDGRDFASSMPGSELDGLYELRSAGEVFKLLARFFAYVGSVAAARAPGTASRSSDVGIPAASTLPFTRVILPG